MSAPRALSPDGFYGWHVVAWSAIALAATGPGQTVGVSLFIDPLIAELGLTRSSVSTAYLIGTLAGAIALPWIGRALDRFGVRRTMAVIGGVFGAVLISLSHVSSLAGLTLGFVGLRMAGQGALGLAASTAVALWFSRRRGSAAGLVSAIGSMGISATPLMIEPLMAAWGWGVVVGPGWSAIGFGAVLGASGAMIRAVEVAALPRYFGTMHIGSIRGVVIAISVAGTAVGPLLFASVFDAVGSYGPALTLSALAPVLVAGWAVVVTEPTVAVDTG